jgi:hypothetical protein
VIALASDWLTGTAVVWIVVVGIFCGGPVGALLWFGWGLLSGAHEHVGDRWRRREGEAAWRERLAICEREGHEWGNPIEGIRICRRCYARAEEGG